MRRFAPLSIIFSCFIILFISPTVYASGLSPEFWAYWWAENQCGVDFTKYRTTDEGSTLSEIIERYGTNQFESTIDLYTDSMKNIVNSDGINEYANNQIDTISNFAKNSFTNTVTTSSAVNQYIGEKARRTITENGKQYLDISGSDYWDSIYNDLFNDGGYKQQYDNTTNDKYSGSVNGHSISMYIRNMFGWTVGGQYCYVVTPNLRKELRSAGGYVNGIITWSIDNEIWYSVVYCDNPDATIEFETVSINDGSIYIKYIITYPNQTTAEREYTYYVSGTPTENDNMSPEGGLIAKPPSCGVINMNGEWVDVPTDPEDRPEGWILNPDGTVTVDGDEYPIYVEIDSGDDDGGGDGGGNPGQLTDPGLFDIIKYISGQPWGNNWNNPWNNYNQPDGNNNNNPFGLSIGDFFNNIGKSIGNVLSSLLGNIPKLLEKILDIIKSLFSLNFLSSMRLDLGLDFSFFTELFNTLLSVVGVS